MAFNSIEYLYFLLIAVVVHQLLLPTLKLPWLLLCSYYFYAQWNHYYLLLIIFSTILDYFCGVRIDRDKSFRRFWVGLSICANLGVLFAFKYYGFFSEIAHDISELLGRPLYLPLLSVLLPVGISFYTFQTMSYSIDVYRGKISAERNFFRFSVYVACFPQLVAGPIERASHLLPQMSTIYRLTSPDLISGVQLIVWGLFKKVVIADRLSMYVQYVFHDNPEPHNVQLVLAGFWANLLIYADFSAYADIAIGSARLLGLHLRKNFNFPLFSNSMPDFWKRWHISLHSWFLDYIYYPLGGGRVPWSRLMLNITIVFLLSGLWHGAAWNFVLWSLFHLSLVLLHVHILKLWRYFNLPIFEGRFAMALRILLVQIQRGMSMFLFFIPDISRCGDIISQWVYGSWNIQGIRLFPFPPFVVIIYFTATIFLFTVEWLHLRRPWHERFAAMSQLRRWACYYTLLLTIMVFGVETNNPFIYFQF